MAQQGPLITLDDSRLLASQPPEFHAAKAGCLAIVYTHEAAAKVQDHERIQLGRMTCASGSSLVYVLSLRYILPLREIRRRGSAASIARGINSQKGTYSSKEESVMLRLTAAHLSSIKRVRTAKLS